MWWDWDGETNAEAFRAAKLGSFLSFFFFNFTMFACHLIAKIPPRLRHCDGMLQDWRGMFASFPHQPPQRQTTVKRGGEAERHQACKKTICVSTSVGTEKWYACGSARAYASRWEAEYYDSSRAALCLCDGVLRMWACAGFFFFFPSTGCHSRCRWVFGNLSCLVWVCMAFCVCVRV